MAAQWPVYLAAHAGSEACSQRSWPEGPRSLWDWLVSWNDCRTFSTDYLVLWGGRQVLAFHCSPCMTVLCMLYAVVVQLCRCESAQMSLVID